MMEAEIELKVGGEKDLEVNYVQAGHFERRRERPSMQPMYWCWQLEYLFFYFLEANILSKGPTPLLDT